MLASGEFDVRESLLEVDVAVKVIRVQDLLPPVYLDAGLLACLDLISMLCLQALTVFCSISSRTL